MASAVRANIDWALRLFLALFLGLLLSAPLSAEMPVSQLRISGHVLTVEIAHTQAARSAGTDVSAIDG